MKIVSKPYLMLWLFSSSGYQPPRYDLCKTCCFWWIILKFFTVSFNVEKSYAFKYACMFLQTNSACKANQMAQIRLLCRVNRTGVICQYILVSCSLSHSPRGACVKVDRCLLRGGECCSIIVVLDIHLKADDESQVMSPAAPIQQVTDSSHWQFSWSKKIWR